MENSEKHEERYYFDSHMEGLRYEIIYSRWMDIETRTNRESVDVRGIGEGRMSLLRSYDKMQDGEKARIKRTDRYDLGETEEEIMKRFANLPDHIKYFLNNVDEIEQEDMEEFGMESEEPPVGLN